MTQKYYPNYPFKNDDDDNDDESSSYDDSGCSSMEEESPVDRKRLNSLFKDVNHTNGGGGGIAGNFNMEQQRKLQIQMNIVEQERVQLVSQRDSLLIEQRQFERKQREREHEEQCKKERAMERVESLLEQLSELKAVEALLERKMGISSPFNQQNQISI